MIEWTVTIGNILSTGLIVSVIVGMYGVVLIKSMKYAEKVVILETELYHIKREIEGLTRSLKLSDAAMKANFDEK